MNGPEGLRRGTAADLDAIVALQRAAFARHRAAFGVDPLPLLADYKQILLDCEVWLLEGLQGLDGLLVIEPRTDDILLWSVATAPRAQSNGVGNRLLDAAEARARELGRPCVRLYTGDRMTDNIAWYKRHGYEHERIETLGRRKIVHLIKHLPPAH